MVGGYPLADVVEVIEGEVTFAGEPLSGPLGVVAHARHRCAATRGGLARAPTPVGISVYAPVYAVRVLSRPSRAPTAWAPEGRKRRSYPGLRPAARGLRYSREKGRNGPARIRTWVAPTAPKSSNTG